MSTNLLFESFPLGVYQCNCSIIYCPSTREAIAIDPGNDPKAFKAVIREKNFKVKTLLHTHAHFDHIGGSSALKQELGCTMALHKGDLFLYEMLREQGRLFGQPVGEHLESLDIYLEDDQTFGFSSEHVEHKGLQDFLKVFHTPGHTPGSCCFYSEALSEPVLFSGDTLFARSIGRTDLPGGNFDLIVKSIKTKLYTLPDETLCVPGHGAFTKIYAEKQHNAFVKED